MCCAAFSRRFNINRNSFNGSALFLIYCDVSAIYRDPFTRLHNESFAKQSNSGTRNSELVNCVVVLKEFCVLVWVWRLNILNENQCLSCDVQQHTRCIDFNFAFISCSQKIICLGHGRREIRTGGCLWGNPKERNVLEHMGVII